MLVMAYLSKTASPQFFETIILTEIDKNTLHASESIKNKDYLAASFNYHANISLTESLRTYDKKDPANWPLVYPFVAIHLQNLVNPSEVAQKAHDAMNHIVLARTLELIEENEKANNEYKIGMELLEIKDKKTATDLANSYLEDQNKK